ncbi:MAG: 30S ribosomal protein S6 [Candidatus Azambacteria bacterium]|nr:30S ribosomal protein S6 [Candidatus Azambacteria bacterium]
MNEAENKREYEMSFLLTPEISEDKLDFEYAELKKLILESGGEATQINPLENRRLAYPIKKQNQAYLGVVYFNIDSDGLDKMKSNLALNTKVLRFLILTHSTSSGLMLSRVEALNKPNKPTAAPLPTTLPSEEKTTEIPSESFDKKLESILKG